MNDLGTILGIWAHPDDEAYLAGALMANSLLRHPALWAIYVITVTVGLLAGIAAGLRNTG